MKLIDEKGRLLGKINIIDFFVIILLLCLTPMVYHGYKLIRLKPVPTQAPKVYQDNVEVTCLLPKLSLQMSKQIKVGDRIIDTTENVIGEITWVGKVKPFQYYFNIGSDEAVKVIDSALYEVLVNIKMRTEIRGQKLYYNEALLWADSPFELKTVNYTVTAIPVARKMTEIRKIENIDFDIILKNLSEDTVKQLAVGDKEIDANGNVVAEIIKLGKKENNTYEINLGKGNFVLGEDTTKKQASVKMRIKSQINEAGQLYFQGQPVTYNSLIEFRLNSGVVQGMITNPLPKETWIELKVKFTAVITEVADVIKEGDVATDPAGKLVGKLKTILSNKPSEIYTITLDQGKLAAIPQPFQKDITAVLNLLCIEQEGKMYFNNYPVKIGNMLSFSTARYSISGVIVGLEEN